MDRTRDLTASGAGAGQGLVEDRQGVVVRVDRGAALVDAGDGERERATWGGALLAAIAHDPERTPCTGDDVVRRRWPDGRRTVEAVLPRRTVLQRAEVSGTSARQPLAANMDVVVVVEGLHPDPDRRRLSRLLGLAWASGAEPVVLLTKADLVPDADVIAAEIGATSACPVIVVSTVTGAGLEEVRAPLREGRVLALLGASGVGKSSLVNALFGGDLMRVRGLRADGKGRHTTVTRELHRWPGGGALIDTPGLRAVGVADDAGVEAVFTDVTDLASGCRFTDCEHGSEPGCAVRAAIDAGEFDPQRLGEWRQLRAEARSARIRRDARLGAEQNREWRARTKAFRRAGVSRPDEGVPQGRGVPPVEYVPCRICSVCSESPGRSEAIVPVCRVDVLCPSPPPGRAD